MRSTRPLMSLLASGRLRSAVLLLVDAGVCDALHAGPSSGLAVISAAVADGPTMAAVLLRLMVTGGVVVADPFLDRIPGDGHRWQVAGRSAWSVRP